MERRSLIHVVDECLSFVGTRVKFLSKEQSFDRQEMDMVVIKLETAFDTLTELHLSHFHQARHGVKASVNLVSLTEMGASVNKVVTESVACLEMLAGQLRAGKEVRYDMSLSKLLTCWKACYVYNMTVMAMFDE